MEMRQGKKAVLITGASTGIGRVTALHLDQLGYQVFASVRKPEDAQNLRLAGSEYLEPVFLDVTDAASIDRARDEIAEKAGPTGLWGVVNNAGISFSAPLECISMNKFRRMFEVNVFGLLAVSQAFLPLLRQSAGRLVNISSVASILVMPFHGTYSASKLAVNGITNALRLELKPFGVQVSNVICGSIRTPIWEKGIHLSRDAASSYTPQQLDLYGTRLRQMGKFFNKIGREGTPPEAAAAKIVHALTSQRPKNTYFVGRDANFYNLMEVFLHGRLRDWFIFRVTGV